MNNYLLLRSLTPTQAIQVLTGGVSNSDGKGLDQVRIKLLAQPNQPLRVMLVVPNVDSPLKSGLVEAYTHKVGNSGMRIDNTLPSDTLSLRDGVLWLLTLPAQDEEPAPVFVGEYLVALGDDATRAEQLLRMIAATATQVAVTAWSGDQAQGYLFHVLADPDRDEAFTTLVEPQARTTVLRAYEAGRYQGEHWLVFAPANQAPARHTLAGFASLHRLADGLFHPPGQPEGSTLRGRKLLVAIAPRLDAPTNGQPPLDVFYLRHLTFSPRERFAPAVRPPSPVRVWSLQNSAAALDHLRQAIDAAGKAQGLRVGYHLRLRSTRFVAEPHRDRDRLLEQKELIEQKLEYLDSTELPRPKLLRFSEQQLPVLADYIRSYPMRVLADQIAVRYAFQSTRPDGTGFHFLLIDPSRAPQIEVDPLPRWERFGDPTIRFWLDPFWARFYLGEGETLVYVPEGHYLTPTMHATTKRELDDYMRAVIGQWCRPEEGVPPIPAKPLYLFEPHATEVNHLEIVVLDHAQFLPLGRRLDWLNKHLHVRHTREKGHLILDRISDVLSEDELLSQLDATKAERAQRLKATITEGAEQVAQSTQQLAQLLTDDLQAILKLSQDTLQSLGEAKERLNQLYLAQNQALALEKAASSAADQLKTTIAAAGKETDALRTAVQTETTRAEQAHQEAESRIAQLDQLYAQLRDRLDQR